MDASSHRQCPYNSVNPIPGRHVAVVTSEVSYCEPIDIWLLASKMLGLIMHKYVN